MRVAWGGRSIVIERMVECEPQPDRPVWRPALDSLETALKGGKIRARQAKVVLSNHLVRYVLVPWRDEVTHPRERLALATHAFEAAYGEMAREWEIRLSETGYGHPGIASAIDRGLLSALSAAFAGTGIRLTSIQPLLMAAFNRLRGQLRVDGALALIEDERLGLGVFRGGHWVHLVTRRTRRDDVTETLIRELATFSDAEMPSELGVMVVGEAPSIQRDPGLPVRLLTLGDPRGAGSLALSAG